MKIEIEVVQREIGTTDFTVSQDDKSVDHLTFDEMLGLIASLTMPERRPCIHWMRTQEEAVCRERIEDKLK